MPLCYGDLTAAEQSICDSLRRYEAFLSSHGRRSAFGDIGCERLEEMVSGCRERLLKLSSRDRVYCVLAVMEIETRRREEAQHFRRIPCPPFQSYELAEIPD